MLGIVALIVTGIALLFDIIGLAIPYWEEVDGAEIHAGLWKSCVASTCYDVKVANDSLRAVRAMVLLGMILLIGAILCALLKLVAMKDQQRLPKVAGLMAIIAGVLIIIGVIIYAADIKTEGVPGIIETNLHAGFALCVISGVVAIVGGALFVVAKD